MQLRLSGHSVYKNEYHIVFCTKYRRKILNPGLETYLGFDNTMKDHVHFEIVIPPKYVVSDVVAKLKSMSASELRKKFDWLKQVYWKENIVWSPGFFSSTMKISKDCILEFHMDMN